jgi:hypothetical protein
MKDNIGFIIWQLRRLLSRLLFKRCYVRIEFGNGRSFVGCIDPENEIIVIDKLHHIKIKAK